MSKDFLRRARSRLLSAEAAFERGDYPDAVRFSQECVELSLKACLRAVGIEYPKVHDVSDVLVANLARFPSWMQERISELAEASKDLAMKRAPAMYGVETIGKPSSELFGQRDAKEAVAEARLAYDVASRFVEEFFEGST